MTNGRKFDTIYFSFFLQQNVFSVVGSFIVVEAVAAERVGVGVEVEVPNVATDSLVVGYFYFEELLSEKVDAIDRRVDDGACIFQLHG